MKMLATIAVMRIEVELDLQDPERIIQGKPVCTLKWQTSDDRVIVQGIEEFLQQGPPENVNLNEAVIELTGEEILRGLVAKPLYECKTLDNAY